MVERSALDSDRFGVGIGRVAVSSADRVATEILEARRVGLQMLIVRVDASDIRTTHAIEAAGGKLCDTLVYYECEPHGHSHPEGIRDATPSDTAAIQAIATRSFKGYLGHYHADPRLDRRAADTAYADWARRSIADDDIDRVWVAEDEERVVGFLTWRVNDDTEAEIVLNAVNAESRRRGHYRRLLEAALAATEASNTRRCIVSSQLRNIAAQRAWIASRFLPFRTVHTFHAWLD